VAKAAVDGLASGRAVVIPGAANRAAAGLAHLAPKALILPLLASQHPALKESKGAAAPSPEG
jgi:short-subunit dehydrogenase